MWYPNRWQWGVIWLTAILALTLWNNSYTGNVAGVSERRLMVSIVIVGALLAWMLARKRPSA